MTKRNPLEGDRPSNMPPLDKASDMSKNSPYSAFPKKGVSLVHAFQRITSQDLRNAVIHLVEDPSKN